MILFSAAVHPLTLPPKPTDSFHGIDFKAFSYPYAFSWGKRVNVHLKNGRSEYDFHTERGWFDLAHVYITDLTNDGHPEAIVMLWHVACGVSRIDNEAGLVDDALVVEIGVVGCNQDGVVVANQDQ